MALACGLILALECPRWQVHLGDGAEAAPRYALRAEVTKARALADPKKAIAAAASAAAEDAAAEAGQRRRRCFWACVVPCLASGRAGGVGARAVLG